MIYLYRSTIDDTPVVDPLGVRAEPSRKNSHTRRPTIALHQIERSTETEALVLLCQIGYEEITVRDVYVNFAICGRYFYPKYPESIDIDPRECSDDGIAKTWYHHHSIETVLLLVDDREPSSESFSYIDFLQKYI